MLTATDEAGDYVIPHIIYSDAYSSETVAFADLILPDTTYLERHDCISLLDRPICEPDALSDAIRWPVVEPERPGHAGVRGFQSVLLDLGVRLGLPGMVDDAGAAIYSDYADYMTNHQRRPGVGPLAGFRGADGEGKGRGDPNPDQIARYIENGGFWTDHIPEEAAFFKPWNAAYQDWAVERGLFDAPQPYLFQLYVEPLAKFQAAATGKGPHQPPEHLRAQLTAGDVTPARLVPAALGRPHRPRPNTRCTRSPSAPPRCTIPGEARTPGSARSTGTNPLYVPSNIWREHGFAEGDWAHLTSPHGRITVPVALMEALNPNTVWTWNAIGKRPGAWALDAGAPEATKGFLLNHLIHELLPPKGDGLRWNNSDPVTGQAAWYDLRVRIEKAPPQTRSAPAFAAQTSPVGQGPKTVAYDAK